MDMMQGIIIITLTTLQCIFQIRLIYQVLKIQKNFFSPPLPYIVPSFVIVFCRNIIESSNYVEDCRPSLALITQIFQTFMFFGTLFIYSKIIKKMYNDIKFSHFINSFTFNCELQNFFND